MYVIFNDRNYDGDLRAVRNDLEELIVEYKLSGISGFPELAATLDYWKEEIISSFSLVKGQRISNEPIEGRNSMITGSQETRLSLTKHMQHGQENSITMSS